MHTLRNKKYDENWKKYIYIYKMIDKKVNRHTEKK